jgi:predicted proteasome-type protease
MGLLLLWSIDHLQFCLNDKVTEQNYYYEQFYQTLSTQLKDVVWELEDAAEDMS